MLNMVNSKFSVMGFLVILVLSLAQGQKKPFKGAEVYSKKELLYGKYEMRMKMPRGGGILGTFFLYKQDAHWAGTFWEEVFLEVFGKNKTNQITTAIKTDGVENPLQINIKDQFTQNDLSATYHIYTLEWTPDYVAWFLDGQEYRRETGPDVKKLMSPLTYRFNAWVSCSTGLAGVPEPKLLPQHQYIDWIQYSAYESETFKFKWRDDFDKFDTSRWGTGYWSFDCNLALLHPDNVKIENGNLVLSVTDSSYTPLWGPSTPHEFKGLIFKNLANQTLVINNQSETLKLSVYNLLGTRLHVQKIHKTEKLIISSLLKPGIYLLKLEGKKGHYIHKLII